MSEKYDCPANNQVAFDPGKTVAEWGKAVLADTEWTFWRENGPAVIDFLREANRALDEGDWT